MEEAFFRQIRRNIESLIIEGQLAEAYSKCKEILEEYPDQKGILDLKRSIEQKLISENKEIVEAGIKEAEEFAKKDEKEKALRKLKELLEISPNNEKLKRIYLKIQKKYKENLEKIQENFLENKKKILKECFSKGDMTELIQLTQTLAREYGENKDMQALVKMYREKIVESELKEKGELLNSTKFDDIESFLKDLKKIDETSKAIQNVENYVKRRKMGSQVENIEEFIFSSEEALVTLMKLKKYEEAIVVANEILKTSPENNEAKKILKKAKRKSFFMNQKEVVRKITQKLPALKFEYEKNKSNFIRI